jgi:hypothetical protein
MRMVELKNMSIEELLALKTQIEEEIKSKQPQPEKKELVLYTHACKNSSNYHRNKYKHWAKLITTVDTSKTNGYAFIGEFLNINAEHKLPVGSIVVEVCDITINAYLINSTEVTRIDSAKTHTMSAFVEQVATYFK